ncbi:MAG: hypothetical protein ACM31C_17235 [Acidobacteriota bacterium]
MKPLVLVASLLFTACMVGDPSEIAPPEDNTGADIGDGDITPELASGCTEMTTVLLYSEGTYALTLPNAFAAAVDPCTRYYVHLPALTADKTQPRSGADKVRALGANFHAMAEFQWGAWRDWIAQSPGTRDWALAGRTFRDRMTAAGYDVAAGDIWAINEFPMSTHTGDNDVWAHERAAIKGLAEGDGTRTVRGVAYSAGMGQTLATLGVYKGNVEGWLSQDAWWADMNRYVRWFAVEVYADPHDNCVIGSSVVRDSDNLSAYVEHLPRLAHEGGAATATAAAYLQHHYVPLLNAAFNSNNGFGDNLIGLGDFVKFSRLQVYATHVWAAHDGYPGRRIGFAWAPKDTTPAQESELSGIIARSVSRAYPANKFYNYGKYACNASGALDGCGCTVAGSYNHAWDTFATW